MVQFVVIGGGITGLSSAFYLSKAVTPSVGKIILLEGSHRLGGWLHSTEFPDGTVFDHGPRSIRSAGVTGANTLKLVEEVGLKDDVLPVARNHPAAINRYLYAQGKLCTLPNSLLSLCRRRAPFSSSFLSQVWREPFKSPQILEDDSIYNFASRRLSEEIAKYVFDPMLRGIFAGDARKLSVKSCFGRLFELEQKYGSVVKGLLKQERVKKKKHEGELMERAWRERWAMWSLSKGLNQLVDTLAERLRQCDNVEIRTNTRCERLQFQGNQATVICAGDVISCDHVFATCLSSVVSPMVEEEHPVLADRLGAVPSAHVAVVNLEYPGHVLPVLGFGHLVPSCEKSDVLGAVYESCVFPQHNQKGEETTRLTCMMGGAWFEELFGDPDTCPTSRLEEAAIRSMAEQLNMKSDPSKVVTHLNKNCLPQYLVGHDRVVNDIEDYIRDNKLPISALGSSYRGPSVNDCIYNAKLAVERVVQV